MMQPKIIRIGVLLLLMLFGFRVAAQRISVTASVGDNTVAMNESVVYTVEIRSTSGPLPNIYNPQAPDAQGLELLHDNASTGRKSIFANGQMTQTYTYTWFYRPLREGEVSIGRTTVVIGKETLTTSPIYLRIVGAGKKPNAPSFRSKSLFDDPFAKDPQNSVQAPPAPEVSKQDVFIRAIPSSTTILQGEQMFIAYYLFARRGVEIRNSRLSDSWDAEGFWREELSAEANTELETIGGEAFRKILIKRVAVFPTRTGQLRVDPLKVQADVSMIRMDDPFDAFLGGGSGFPQNITIASEPLAITVRALPSNAPQGFAGAVGRLNMTAKLDKERVEVGSPVMLTVMIGGSGNIATLATPVISVPEVVEKYDPEVSSDIDRSVQVYGNKTFRFTLIPRENGQHTIPAFTFSYFDLLSNSYKTITAGPFKFTATGTAQSLTSGKNVFPVNDIAAILPQSGTWITRTSAPLHRQWWPLVVFLLPIAGLLALVYYRRLSDRMQTDVAFARTRTAQSEAQKHLHVAQKLMEQGQPKAFYDEVARAVTGFLGDRLNIPEKGMLRMALLEKMTEAGMESGLRSDMNRLLDTSDAVRFSPILPTPEIMQSSFEEAVSLIERIEAFYKLERKKK
ncbi:MAG TPA: BatD family protein [Rhodothermales bacterium]|nr:BatD family protein [Rhodothermales bacterium]